MKPKAREKLDQQRLSERLIYKNLRSIFPRANDYISSESEYSDELTELFDFGIFTNKQLRLLLKKHRKAIICIDRSPIDTYHKNMYIEEMGRNQFNDHIRKNYWFAYPALLRLSLELEFGAKYEQYANKRDGI